MGGSSLGCGAKNDFGLHCCLSLLLEWGVLLGGVFLLTLALRLISSMLVEDAGIKRLCLVIITFGQGLTGVLM